MHDAEKLYRTLREERPCVAERLEARDGVKFRRLGVRVVDAVEAAQAVRWEEDAGWEDRLERLWGEVVEGERPLRKLAIPKTSDHRAFGPGVLAQSFLRRADRRELGEAREPGEEPPPNHKAVHIRGVVAKMKLEMWEHDEKWTGMLAKGAESYGLLRASNGNEDPTRDDLFATGIAWKFPHDGKEGHYRSVDMLFGGPIDGAKGRTGGQFLEPHNVVRTWFGGIPRRDPEFRNVRTLFWMFGKVRRAVARALAQRCPVGAETALSVAPLAEVDQAGHRAPDDPSAPAGLVLTPTDEAVALWAAAVRRADAEDFREIFLELPGEERWPMYTVSSVRKGRRDTLRDIGMVWIESEFVASSFGDDRLFFRHPMALPLQDILG